MDTRGQGLDKARKVLMRCGTLRRSLRGWSCTHVRHKFLEAGRQEQTPGAANHVIVMHEVTSFGSTSQTRPTWQGKRFLETFSLVLLEKKRGSMCQMRNPA